MVVFLCLVSVQTILLVGCNSRHKKIIRGPELTVPTQDLSLARAVPKATGWDQAQLKQAMNYMDSIGTTSTIVFHHGNLVAEWGEIETISDVHSVRKSIVSALYGIAIEKGLINLNSTLNELGIDDENPALTKEEKEARLEDLLTCRSGIYHPSIKDHNGASPATGSHPPNTHFYYNNWSFNAAGIIFEKLTKMKLGEAFQKWIAIPTQMDDFKVEDVIYTSGKESVFPAYRFRMSGRDLARFALLYHQQGKWNKQQIIPADWIKKSLTRYSGGEDEVAYGYMWWIMPSGVYMATGTGGQKIWLDPKNDLLIVNRVNTGQGLSRGVWHSKGVRVNNTHMRKLNELLVAAKPG